MNIHFRKLLPSDTKQYRETRLGALKLFPENFGSSYETEAAKPKLAFEINIELQNDKAFIVGAFDGEKLFGICGFVQETNEKTRHRGLKILYHLNDVRVRFPPAVQA